MAITIVRAVIAVVAKLAAAELNHFIIVNICARRASMRFR